MRRVVITGLGAVSPHGLGTEAFFSGLLEGKSSIGPLTRFDPTSFASRIAGVVPQFKTTDYVPKSYRKATKIMARDIELAVVAADFAVRDAKFVTRGIAESGKGDQLLAEGWSKFVPTRVGCNIGAGLISPDMDELTQAMVAARDGNTLNLARWGKSDDPSKPSGMDNLTPLWLLKYLPNMLACHVSIIHDTQGPSNTITCGQASAGLALAEAHRTIQRNEADIALIGGCETKLHPMGLLRWILLNRLTSKGNDSPTTACRPFDKDASGTVLAEGGAVLVIEEYEHAKKRGATIYAEIAGLGASANGVNVLEPDPTGEAPAVAMKKAIKDAGITPDQVNVIVPTGFGVPVCDASEAKAIRQVFGDSLAKQHVMLTRGGIGDCSAGVQALDLVAAALSIKRGVVPPAVNCPNPIDGMPVAQQKVETEVNHAVVLTCALGGQNSAVVLKKV